MADMHDLPCGIREMSWGQCENEELEKKETGHVTVAQIEILVVSVNKLCFSSATQLRSFFFLLPLSTRKLCWVSEGTQGTLMAQLLFQKHRSRAFREL